MAGGHPAGLPDLFLDRSLGRHQVPNLLRREGLRLRTLSEAYGVPADESVADVEWLELAGRNRWVVFMKDTRIRYRPAEREILLGHEVRAFCLTGGNLRAASMAEHFLGNIEEIARVSAAPGPFLYAVSHKRIARLDL
ncbi:MAG: PIN-like domain-containing protein [Actinomycetes bacterium]